MSSELQKKFIDGIAPIDFGYEYRVGQYLDRYIDGLGEGKIWAIKCPGCGRVVVPPRSICGDCNARMEEWVEVGPGGTVENYTVGRVRLEKGEVKDSDSPLIVGLIKLDGADALFAGEIREMDPGKLEQGFRVTAVFKDEPDGTLQDLAYFEPEGS